MKITKLVSVVLATVFMCVALSSCGNIVTVKDVSLAVITESTTGVQTVHQSVVVTDVKGKDGNAPTVMDAVIQLLEENGVTYKLSDDGSSIKTIGGKSEGVRRGYSYFWEFTVKHSDGKVVDGVRAAEMEIAEGDHIVYYLIPSAVEGGDSNEAGNDTEVEENGDETPSDE